MEKGDCRKVRDLRWGWWTMEGKETYGSSYGMAINKDRASFSLRTRFATGNSLQVIFWHDS